jgi:hypothetical protein
MTDLIKGRDLLESPYDLNRRDISKFVQDGTLVPYESPDAEYIKSHKILDADSERIWRVFPTPELQKKWLIELCLKQDRLEEAQKWSSKSDEEHIEYHKHDLNLDWGGAPPNYLVDLETFIDRNLPLLRQKYLQITKDFPSQIKNLEEKFAPNRVWKDLDLGPTQQETLMDKLLDAWYPLDQVEAISGAKSQKIIPNAKTTKLTVPPGTQWKDIKITLISDDTVRIKTPNLEERFNYSELALSDKRKSDSTTLLWELLKLFAKNNGLILSNDPDYDPKLLNSTKRLNKHLKELFGINDSIYQGQYKIERGYRTKIFFSDQTSVLLPDVSGLAQNQATRTRANASKIIEGKDEIQTEIEDLFAEEQDKVPHKKQFE